MQKRNAIIFASLGILVLFIGVSLFLNSGEVSEGQNGLNAVKSTSSFQELSEDGEADIKSYEIGEETVSLAKKSDYPYNWSSNKIGEKNSTFVLAVDLAGFEEEESRLVIAKNSERAHIYQLQDGNIINNISGVRLLNEVMQAKNEREMQQTCEKSSITVEKASMTEGSLSIRISVSGGELARWIHVDVDLEEGTNDKDEIIDAGENYTFKFEKVNSLEEVENISIETDKSDDCDFDERTLSELPLKK